jgi:hypothetical protein
MADEPDEVLELTEDQVIEPDAEEETNDTESQEEVVVSFGDEAAPASEERDSEVLRNLRKQYREVVRERDALKQQTAPKVPQAGPKPTLWDDGIDGDEDKLADKIIEWHGRVQAEEATKSEAEKQQAAAREKFEAKVAVFAEQKQTLPVKDFDDAEAEVLGTLSQVQQRILIHGAENKAQLVYALGKHPEKLKALASIQDPIEFAFAAAKLEDKAKMERRKVTTSPESEVRGSAPLSGLTDKTLERLEAEAAKTGNRTKVIAYKRQLKAKGQ